jgi:DNA (cytosine-5)-methyltransferase 1
MKNQIGASYVSLFSAAGLGCFGLKQAGFECVATAELLPRRMEVQKANNVVKDESGYILGDFSNIETQDLLYKRYGQWLSQNPGRELTLLIASPPCQGMSVANHKKGDELARNSLVVESIRAIQKIKPRFFLFENVRSFLTTRCVDMDGENLPIGDAISKNLASDYLIASRVINFKDFGASSSRTRTLVLGVRRDQHDCTPWDFFPQRAEAVSLRSLIGHLPRLTVMGEISPTDIFHGFRSYDPRMRPWISNLQPGESAFGNDDPGQRPHRMVDGLRLENLASNSDKYRRNLWDKTAPCVHTRNDILASQSTVHPEDDRVFSIRELCLMMGVPEEFKWTQFGLEDLNRLPEEEKVSFLKENEMNIRQCLGEGIPTPIVRIIGQRVREYLENGMKTPAAKLISDAENSNPRKKELAAFYTRLDIASQIVSRLPEFKGKKSIRVLEPSVGGGAFLVPLAQRYWDRELIVDAVDIDPNALRSLEELRKSSPELANLTINKIDHDFLTWRPSHRYEIVVGNPPFGKPNARNIDPEWVTNLNCKDLFARFIERAMGYAEYVALLVPKTLLSAPEHALLRDAISANSILSIDDFGEMAFSTIKIETIGLVFKNSVWAKGADVKVLSYPLGRVFALPQDYICEPRYPTWLIYRNSFFDSVAKKLTLGTFSVIRDRELSNKQLADEGNRPVYRAANIPRPGQEPERIRYLVGDKLPVASKQYRDEEFALIAPNLSYYPRAMRLPVGALVDGSAAVLVPHDARAITENAIQYFSTRNFFYFYRIARNYSTRSLNIDSCSVHYWGLLRGESKTEENQIFYPTSEDVMKYDFNS